MTDAAPEIVILHGRPFIVVATVHTDREEKLVVDARSGHPVLSMRRDGRTGIPSAAALSAIDAASTDLPNVRTESVVDARMRLELEMLDAAEVRNGTKAIWLWLNANWTDDLRTRLGDFDDPATIKRWRTELRRLRDEKA